jgi:hypothetical protein
MALTKAVVSCLCLTQKPIPDPPPGATIFPVGLKLKVLSQIQEFGDGAELTEVAAKSIAKITAAFIVNF